MKYSSFPVPPQVSPASTTKRCLVTRRMSFMAARMMLMAVASVFILAPNSSLAEEAGSSSAGHPRIILPEVLITKGAGKALNQQPRQAAPCARRVGKVVMATACSEGVLRGRSPMLTR